MVCQQDGHWKSQQSNFTVRHEWDYNDWWKDRRWGWVSKSLALKESREWGRWEWGQVPDQRPSSLLSYWVLSLPNPAHRFCWEMLEERTSRVVRWLRILLTVQGTQVRSLAWEDSTCSGAIKPMHRNYWNPHALEPTLFNERSRHNEKLAHHN